MVNLPRSGWLTHPGDLSRRSQKNALQGSTASVQVFMILQENGNVGTVGRFSKKNLRDKSLQGCVPLYVAENYTEILKKNIIMKVIHSGSMMV